MYTFKRRSILLYLLHFLRVSFYSITEIGSWAKIANNIVKRSETERVKSSQLRSDIDTVMNTVSYEMYEAWENTNKALNRRAIELLEAKEKLQSYLHKVVAQEIKITIRLFEFLLEHVK